MCNPRPARAYSNPMTKPKPKRKPTPKGLDHSSLYTGLRDAAEREDRRRLLEDLSRQGATFEMLEAAVREERLSTLPVEFALNDGSRYTLTEVARRANVDPRYVRAVLLSLGHPNPRPRERRFSDRDVEVAQILRSFLDAGLPREEILEVSRVVGQSMARVAAAVRAVVGNSLMNAGDSEHTLGMRYAEAARQLAPLMGPVMQQQLEVHLREQATREVITRADRESGGLARTREVGVCFADLSGFTRLGQRLPPDEIGAIGNRMAEMAGDVARPPVELIKTIGDGVMLVSPRTHALLDAAIALRAKARAEGVEFPPMRAGIALGPAVQRSGDWFGPAVNCASRIVDVARPGSIVVDEPARDQAGDGREWSKRKRKRLKGIEGRVSLYTLEQL
jgi:adenylate cyclase